MLPASHPSCRVHQAAAAVAPGAPTRDRNGNKDKLRPDGRRIFADNGNHYCLRFQTSGCTDPCPHKQAHQCELLPGVHKSTDCKGASDATKAAIRAALDKAMASNAARAANPQPKKKGGKKQL